MASLRLLPPSFAPWTKRSDTGKSIILLMSGGVDSSVTAHLLKEAGWNILGVTMKVPVADTDKCGLASPCCGADAALVANEIGICHYYIDSLALFSEKVIEPFKNDYANGRTPNPCVNCNSYLKYTAVWDFLRETFGDLPIASGHYARILDRDQQPRLARARDKHKDQSYFLYGIPASRLGDVYFPLGEMASKNDTRAIARDLGLRVAEKKDSMELCFAGEDDYRQALTAAQQPGRVLDTDGKEVGTHDGIQNYTLGQRRGVGVAMGEPAYVLKILPAENTLIIGAREDALTHTVSAQQLNILTPDALTVGSRIAGCIRSGGTPRPCVVASVSETEITVTFDEPTFAPTPGQHLVLYDDDCVLGGGTITHGAVIRDNCNRASQTKELIQ